MKKGPYFAQFSSKGKKRPFNFFQFQKLKKGKESFFLAAMSSSRSDSVSNAVRVPV